MNPWCRPVTRAPRERPTLVLLLGGGREEAFALAVGAGCEEEGIPLVWESAEGGASELAREAAGRSRLEVGIGIDGNSGAVTFAKYPSPEAYLRIEVGDEETARWLGQAAARFVKSKPLPDRFDEAPGRAAAGVPQKEAKRTVREEIAAAPSGDEARSPVPTEKDLSEAVVDRVTRAVLEALRRQR